MAHMARAAGTDYAVAGGKTLIDGTAYSVVATREVEKTIVISRVLTSLVGNSYTIEDDRLDYDKYKVVLAQYTGAPYGGGATGTTSGMCFFLSYTESKKIASGYRGSYPYAWATPDVPSVADIFNFSTNGKATFAIPSSWNVGQFVPNGIFTIVLEAKT